MMNRGVLQSSPVQQMMAAGNPSWWNINNFMRPPLISPTPPNHHHHHHNHHQYYHHHQQQQQQLSSSSSSSTTNFMAHNDHNNNDNNNNTNVFQAHQYNNMNNMSSTTPCSSSWLDDHINHPQHLLESWSQLLLAGVCMVDEQEQVILQQHPALVDVKQENNSSVDSYNSNNNNNNNNMSNNVYTPTSQLDQEFQLPISAAQATNWCSTSHLAHQMNNIPATSPQSCVTTFSGSNSMLDFSSKPSDTLHARHPPPDRSSECNSGTNNGGALKKAKVQPSSTQPTFKVKKEKLGDRITALHRLVSPFGKTDTASVLLEAIGYIRFLQSQIEALSLPYLSSGSGNMRQPQPVKGERNCIFPEDPGQLLNDNCLKRKGGPDQDSYEEPKDLRSRGLCLVPVSCTLHVGSDNGADYWAPALGGGFR